MHNRNMGGRPQLTGSTSVGRSFPASRRLVSDHSNVPVNQWEHPSADITSYGELKKPVHEGNRNVPSSAWRPSSFPQCHCCFHSQRWSYEQFQSKPGLSDENTHHRLYTPHNTRGGPTSQNQVGSEQNLMMERQADEVKQEWSCLQMMLWCDRMLEKMKRSLKSRGEESAGG